MPNVYTIKKYDGSNLSRMFSCSTDTVYRITPMIGFRDSINQPWVISVFWGRQVECCSAKESCDIALAKYLFIDLKDKEKTKVVEYGINKGGLEGEKFGYNLQDEDFWEKCWVIQKDTFGSIGLYYMQEMYFRSKIHDPNDKDYRKCFQCATNDNYPKIDYPKEILDMYRK